MAAAAVGSMGTGAIGYAEIAAYCEIFPQPDRRRFTLLIRAMDSALAKHRAKKEKAREAMRKNGS